MISHNLPETFAVADRITVVRLGRNVDTLETRDSSVEAIVGMMTGIAARRRRRCERMTEHPFCRRA